MLSIKIFNRKRRVQSTGIDNFDTILIYLNLNTSTTRIVPMGDCI